MPRWGLPPIRPKRRRSGIVSLVLALALAAGLGALVRPGGRQIEGAVHVVDGDSLRLGDSPIRLKGIDAPELAQTCARAGRPYPCGIVARDALRQWIAGTPVQCKVVGRDRYQRGLAYCRSNGNDMGARLVEEGYAIAYGEYELQEARARSRRAGLWSGTFDRPQDWRREHGS